MRPERVVLVCGTGTEVGKTWVAAAPARELRSRGPAVAARKPAQSFDVDRAASRLGGPTDAEVLAAASGEHPGDVCHSFRSYHRAMAPPIAAQVLGLPPFTVADLVGELDWPTERGRRRAWWRRPVASARPRPTTATPVDLAAALAPDVVVLVADAGLGTINSVRLTMDALGSIEGTPGGTPVVVVLNHFDRGHEIHRRNQEWLTVREGYRLVTLPGGEVELADEIEGS